MDVLKDWEKKFVKDYMEMAIARGDEIHCDIEVDISRILGDMSADHRNLVDDEVCELLDTDFLDARMIK